MRKLWASSTDSMLPNFIISRSMCWSLLWSALCPCPGSGADAKLVPYSSSCALFFPKKRPASGAMMGHFCPRYLDIVILKMSLS